MVERRRREGQQRKRKRRRGVWPVSLNWQGLGERGGLHSSPEISRKKVCGMPL